MKHSFSAMWAILPLTLASTFLACKKDKTPAPGPASNIRTVYWAAIEGVDGGLLIRGTTKADGTTTEDTLYRTSDGVNMPWAIAIDRQRNFIYWINNNTEIKRAALDGSGNVKTIYSAAQDLHWTQEMTLDVTENKLYIADYEDKGTIKEEKILIGNLNTPGRLDTTYIQQVHSTSTNGNTVGIRDIKIDRANNKIYWTESTYGDVMQGTIDGYQTPKVLFRKTVDGINSPQMIALDPAHGKIYISDHEVYKNGAIYVGNIDGSGTPTKLLEEHSTDTYPTCNILELETDLEYGFVYWMNSNTAGDIRRMKLDGTEVQTLYTGIRAGYFFDVDQ
jgi:DNA-binding beta-propeller fold protein YncE